MVNNFNPFGKVVTRAVSGSNNEWELGFIWDSSYYVTIKFSILSKMKVTRAKLVTIFNHLFLYKTHAPYTGIIYNHNRIYIYICMYIYIYI